MYYSTQLWIFIPSCLLPSHTFNLLPTFLSTHILNANLICHLGSPQLASFLDWMSPPGASEPSGLPESAQPGTGRVTASSAISRLECNTTLWGTRSDIPSNLQRAWMIQPGRTGKLAFPWGRCWPKENHRWDESGQRHFSLFLPLMGSFKVGLLDTDSPEAFYMLSDKPC